MDLGAGMQSGVIASGPTAQQVLDSPNLVCECGNKIFAEGYIVKKVSRILTGSASDTMYPIPVYYCTKCGKIPSEFLEKANAAKILGEDKEE